MVVSVCQLELSLSLLLQASYSLLCLLAENRGGGGGAIAREKDRGPFLNLTQRMSRASTAPDAFGESQKNEGESQGCLSPQRRYQTNPPWVGLVQSTGLS